MSKLLNHSVSIVLTCFTILSCKVAEMKEAPIYKVTRDVKGIKRPVNIEEHAHLYLVIYGSDTTGLNWVECSSQGKEGIICVKLYDKEGNKSTESYYSTIPFDEELDVGDGYLIEKPLGATPSVKLKNDSVIRLIILDNHPNYTYNYKKCGEAKQQIRILLSPNQTEQVCVSVEEKSQGVFEIVFINEVKQKTIRLFDLVGDVSKFKPEYLNQIRYYDIQKRELYLYKRNFFLKERI